MKHAQFQFGCTQNLLSFDLVAVPTSFQFKYKHISVCYYISTRLDEESLPFH